jgi:hypothetical protein
MLCMKICRSRINFQNLKEIEKKKYKLGRSLNGTELFSQYFLQLEGKLNGANLSVH